MNGVSHIIRRVIVAMVIDSFAQRNMSQDFSLHGYMDMVLIADYSKNYKLLYLNAHRANLLPQFTISPKLNATMLIECADLFKLDEPDAQESSGIIEWAYLTYRRNNEFNFRVGTFALPFGIYNESFYATPTQLTSFLPNAAYYKQNYYSTTTSKLTGTDSTYLSFSDFSFPRNSSGIMSFGKVLDEDRHHLTYYLYFTNELPNKYSLNLNKYVGGRLLYESTSELLKIGASYCTQIIKNTQVKNTLGFDARFQFKGLQVFTEVVLPTDSKRNNNGYLIEGEFYKGIGNYIQAGYTLNDIFTPYFRYSYFTTDMATNYGSVNVFTSGLNIAFNAQVIWKIEYRASKDEVSAGYQRILVSSLAIGF